MRRIYEFIEKLTQEEKYSKIGMMVCYYMPCGECPNTKNGYAGCEGTEKFGKWLLEEVKTESYTERVITAYDHFKCPIKSDVFDDYIEEIVKQYTFIIRNEEDLLEARARESYLRLRFRNVKVQDFIHEKTETLPWDKEE